MKANNIALIVAGVLLIALTPFGPLSTVAKDVLTEAMASPPSSRHAGPLAAPAGTAFTYQGQLTRGGDPVTDVCSMQFLLWDAEEGGSQIGGTLTRSAVQVEEGLFAVDDLDFGAAAFMGEARWLEVAVQCPGDPDYTTLDARQEITPTPYALYALDADTLDGQHGGAYALASHVHNAADLTAGTLASGRLSGGYAGVTAVGSLTSLTVTGDASVGGEYNYSAARTCYLSIGAAEFVRGSHHTTWASFTPTGTNVYIAANDGSVYSFLVAGVHLPSGATVTGLSCKVYDNDPTKQVDVVLSRNVGTGSYSNTSCDVWTVADSASPQTISGTCSHVVDNLNNAYFLLFNMGLSNTAVCSGGGTDCRIYMCAITYTQTRVP